MTERFDSFDQTPIGYETHGSAPWVVLLHGFASDHHVNWVRPGVVTALEDAGFGVVLTDLRGHGSSGAPEDPAAYEGRAMARDVEALMDHLALESCDLVGYSMGAFVALAVAAEDDRVRSVVAAGVGDNVLAPPDRAVREAIADALETADPRSIDNPYAKGFRDFADLTGANRRALAAIQRASRDERAGVSYLDRVKVPVLVVCGDRDELCGTPDALAQRLPDGRAEVVGGTHLNAVNNRALHKAIVEFLRSV